MAINDCLAPAKKLLSVPEALVQLRDAGAPVVETEMVSLAAASGRILAEPLISGRDIPGFDNAAVDGYALCAEDLNPKGPTRLPLVGQVTAGHATDEALQTGTTLRILTGAKLPEGADTVVMQEDVELGDGEVIFPAGIKGGSNWRPRGEDVANGKLVRQKGQRLRAQDIGMAAAIGCSRLRVYNSLRVAVFSTGDEILEPGEPLAKDSVYDINRYMLKSWLRGMGCDVTDLGILKDEYDVVREALTDAATTHDVIMTSGGASTGDTDHIAAVLTAEGSLNFWRLAMKPGKPLALGQLGEATFIGLPGNPVAVGVCFLRFAYPLLCGLSGQRWQAPVSYQLPAAFAMKKKAGRTEFVRATLQQSEQGLQADRYPKQGSGILSSLVEADGLIELAEDLTGVEVGDLVTFYPIDQFGFL
jgi:molybdopterin molybdotransferase